MIEIIGLDEKDVDKAMKDAHGLPMRAPRDLKDGEIFFQYVGPGTVVTKCSIGDDFPQGEMVGIEDAPKAITS